MKDKRQDTRCNKESSDYILGKRITRGKLKTLRQEPREAVGSPSLESAI